MYQTPKFDRIAPMLILTLGVLAASAGAQVLAEIPTMTKAIQAPRLVPVTIVVDECGEVITTQDGLDVCADGNEYAPIDVSEYLPVITSRS